MATVTMNSTPSATCLTRKTCCDDGDRGARRAEDLKPVQRQDGDFDGSRRARRAARAAAGRRDDLLAIAAATALRSVSGVIGLRRKSVAPSRIASTASSIDAKAVTISTQASGVRVLDPLQRFEAVEPRHLLIEDDDVVRAAVAEAVQPVFRRAGLVHLVSGRFERQAHHLPDVRFVVDDAELS